MNLRRCLEAAAALALITGLLVRLTFRDEWLLTGILFYATPWPVLIGLSSALAGRWRGNRRLLAITSLTALACFLAWCASSWRFAPDAETPANLRVVQWNVSRPEWHFPAVVQALRSMDADVIALSEASPRKRTDLRRWQAAFPEYAASAGPGNLLCLVRGEIAQTDSGTLGRGSDYHELEVKLQGRTAIILQIDVAASPSRSRREPLQALQILVAQRAAQQPLIVLGDFNTPRDSVHLTPFREHLTDTFTSAGRGYGATWPLPLPLLALDQIWTSSHFQALRCTHELNPRSDHRAVLVELAWR